MSVFTAGPHVTPLPGSKRRWVLLRPFSYDVGEKDSGVRIEVPARFTTDFASVPRVAWPIVSPIDHPSAPIIHDWLYFIHQWPDHMPMTRKQADQILLEALQVDGAGWLKRRMMYRAVRMFGGRAWRSKRERFYDGAL